MFKRLLLTMALTHAAGSTAAAQPLAFSKVIQPASTMDAKLRAAVQKQAGVYPLEGFAFFDRDSVMLVFIDSSYTGAAVKAGKWMFGPPATAAELDGCPGDKVLGRKIARALFRAMGRPAALQQVVVTVRGAVGIDRWSASDLHYDRERLTAKWEGDPNP